MSGYDEIRGRDNRMRGDDVCDHLKQVGDHCEECDRENNPYDYKGEGMSEELKWKK